MSLQRLQNLALEVAVLPRVDLAVVRLGVHPAQAHRLDDLLAKAAAAQIDHLVFGVLDLNLPGPHGLADHAQDAGDVCRPRAHVHADRLTHVLERPADRLRLFRRWCLRGQLVAWLHGALTPAAPLEEGSEDAHGAILDPLLIRRLLDSTAVTAQATAAVARSGILAPQRPDKVARMGLEVARRGPLGAAATVAAIRWGDRTALVDELGSLTYRQIDERSNALANGWLADGLKAGDTIAILCRNHRGFMDSAFAAAKAGLRAVYMNTEFAGPQIDDVCEREGVAALVFDEEYDDRAPRWAKRHYRGWSESGGAGSAQATLEELIAGSPSTPVDAGGSRPTVVMLTSGTTGTPKGAPRSEVGTINSLGALLDRIPLRTGEVTYIAPPFFHALGFANLSIALSFGSMIVCRRRFDPEEFLRGVQDHRATTAVVVPAMLQRTLALGRERIAGFDTSSLRIIFCGGSQLPGVTATETLETFGDVLYVLYGSTEVSYASISVPRDHREAPTSVGKPTLGTRVRLLDEEGNDVSQGQTGRIFVSNGMEFEGYTDGQTKEVVAGLMSSGDVGHFDVQGRLFIDGRDDDMIVSGGENVFPQEVEELLLAHPDLSDAAVIGVDDEDFGQRLAAYLVSAGDPPGAEEIKGYVRSNLARYKVPRDVHFVDELPRNATGKIVKRKLSDPT